MSYSWHDTICVFTHDMQITKQAELFARKNGMKIFKANCEADLVGVPFWLAVVDYNLLTSDYLDYLTEVIGNDETWSLNFEPYLSTEKIITHTKPLDIPNYLSQYIIFKERAIFDDICLPNA